MPDRTPRPLRRTLVIAGIAAAVLIAGGSTIAAVGASGQTDAAPEERPAASTAPDTGAAGGLQDPVAAEPIAGRTDATAVRVEIPRIGVDSGLEQLSLDAATGVLDPPVEFMAAGWYKDGTVPGDTGPAVIAGHVDSVTAPAVFYRLGELVAGDEIRVTLSDGAVETFIVDSQQSAPKDAFPTQQVYGPTPTAQLRLITCDGDFNSSTGHYVDNLIVNAHLAA